MKFTEKQKVAIETIDKNLQIVACAGSGKTSTIVARIINMIDKGCLPESIVAITYTDKAAASLKHKIYEEYEKKFGTLEGLGTLYIGTIHGYCMYLLQEYTHEYKSFEVLNEIQTKLLIKKTRNENGLFDVLYFNRGRNSFENLAWERMTANRMSERITTYKNFLDIARECGLSRLSNPTLEKIVKKYCTVLEQNKYFDYTSILMTTLSLMQHGAFDEYLMNKVKYLVVDEYQDVNDVQEDMIKYMNSKGVSVCVVGDDDQTIYNWRGSKLKYIKEFTSRYDNTHKIELDTNFRSSEGITDSASLVIVNNINRMAKKMISQKVQKYVKGDILALEFNTREEEVNFIVNKIKQILGNDFKKDADGESYGLGYDDMAILVSSVKNIEELINALDKNGIKFIVEGTQTLFDAPEIQALCDTFALIFNVLSDKDADYKTIVNDIIIDQNLLDEWKAISTKKSSVIINAIKSFLTYFAETDPYEYTIQANLKVLLVKLGIINRTTDEKVLYNIGKFTEMVNDFEKVFLQYVPFFKLKAFSTFLNEDAPNLYAEGWLSPSFKTIRSLRIMTFHQAKGLEFPVIFMPFLTKNAIFPMRGKGGISPWSIINNDSIQNEYNDAEAYRRVFYVGMTRSEKYLYMTRSDVPWGRGTYREPARPFVEAQNSDFVLQNELLDIKYIKNKNLKFSQDEVLTLNFSLLRDLFECPYKFQLSNVYGFKDPLDIRMGYGKSIHDMLDYIHKEFKKIPSFDRGTIENIVDKYLYLPYASKLLIEAIREKAINKLEAYVNTNKDKFEYIIFSEKSIDYKLDDYFFIDGRIDLIRNSQNNETTIVDFKSSELALSKNQIKNQLMIYVVGYESMTGDKVNYIESYDINATKPTRIEVTDYDRKQIVSKLNECQKTIRTSSFKRICDTDSSIDAKYCKGRGCSYVELCYNEK